MMMIIWRVASLNNLELFPTAVRSMARGVCNVGARLGSAVAPLITQLRFVDTVIPYVIFAILLSIQVKRIRTFWKQTFKLSDIGSVFRTSGDEKSASSRWTSEKIQTSQKLWKSTKDRRVISLNYGNVLGYIYCLLLILVNIRIG